MAKTPLKGTGMGKNERSNLAPKVREETETERVGGWSVDLVPQVFQERCSGACGDAIHLHVGDVGNHGSSVTAQPLGGCVCQTQKTAIEIKATAIEELVLPYASTVSIRSWAKVGGGGGGGDGNLFPRHALLLCPF